MKRPVIRLALGGIIASSPLLSGQGCMSDLADLSEYVIGRTPLEDYPEGPVTEIPRYEAGEYARRIKAENYSGDLENILGDSGGTVAFGFPAEMVVYFNEYNEGYNCLYIDGEFQTAGKPVYVYVSTARNAFLYFKSSKLRQNNLVFGEYNISERLFAGNITPGVSGIRVQGVKPGEFGLKFDRITDDSIFYISADAGPQGIPIDSQFIVRSLRVGNIQ